jgi:hypothetical protein
VGAVATARAQDKVIWELHACMRWLTHFTGGTCFSTNASVADSSTRQCACAGSYSPSNNRCSGFVDSSTAAASFPSPGCGVDGPTSYDGESNIA